MSDAAQQIYDQMWAEASERLTAGTVTIDPHLSARQDDRRTGITLIARPGPAVTRQIARLLDELRAQEPEQHFYRPDELHVTVMTLISASESFSLSHTLLAAYQVIL